MDTPDEFDTPDDELDELDVTEEEFDRQMVTGEPVLVIGLGLDVRTPKHIEDYYTIQVSDSRRVPTSAGPWGGGPQAISDPAQVASTV